MLSSFFFSVRRRHARYWRDWSSDVCSSDLELGCVARLQDLHRGRLGVVVDRELHVGERLAAAHPRVQIEDRKSVVQGKSVDLGGRRIIKKKTGAGMHQAHDDYPDAINPMQR